MQKKKKKRSIDSHTTEQDVRSSEGVKPISPPRVKQTSTISDVQGQEPEPN